MQQSYFLGKPNKAEREIKKNHSAIYAQRDSLARKSGFESFWRYGREGYLDNSDAFRHAYWSALLCKKVGEEWATRLTDAHETDDTGLGKQMDLFNNRIGIEIALKNLKIKNDELAILVQESVDRGKMRIVKENRLIPSNKKGRIKVDIFDVIFNKVSSLINEYVKKEGDLTIKNQDGFTPTMYSMIKNYWKGFCILLKNEKNNNLNYFSDDEETLLTLAAKESNPCYLEKILAVHTHIDVNFQTPKRQMTALMCAARYGHEQHVQMLLDRSKIELKDCSGLTALDHAQIENQKDIVKLLKKIKKKRQRVKK